MTYRKKMIEVALPLDAINQACKPETENPFLKHQPKAIHNWWSRKPLVVCRAMIFASLVDDPGEYCDSDEEAEEERQRLFRIIESLVLWENTANETVLMRARREIARSVARNAQVPEPKTDDEIWKVLDEHAPPVQDPFCGGGSIPLEAQRLGLKAYASDLNPVAVLITKALVEIPPRFAGKPPVNPDSQQRTKTGAEWNGARGLAEDVRHYGNWMKDEALKRLAHLYPKGPNGEAVIAWLWARSVQCPNPACGAQMPLVASFELSKKKGRRAWLEPVIDRSSRPPVAGFRVVSGEAAPPHAALGTSMPNENGRRLQATFRCPSCLEGIAKGDYIDAEAEAGRMITTPLAVVLQTRVGRIYKEYDETVHGEAVTNAEISASRLDGEGRIPRETARGTFASNAQGRVYGFNTFGDYFTSRQLVALTTFSELVGEARGRVLEDAKASRSTNPAQAGSLADDRVRLDDGGSGATAYADAVSVYLACAVSRISDYCNSLASWNPTNENIGHLFQRQGIPMTWSFAELNPNWDRLSIQIAAEWVAGSLTNVPSHPAGACEQYDIGGTVQKVSQTFVLTDPPYYDYIGFADLADFFYVWLRRCLREILPDLFATILTPKDEELTASPYRAGYDKQLARGAFRERLGRAFVSIRECSSDALPFVVFYAYKQQETTAEGRTSTGWEAMLESVIEAGFQVTATWPVRATKAARAVARNTNALASAVVLACRKRPKTAAIATRQEFVSALQSELRDSLRRLQQENIAPVDMAQAAIGPGMAIFSRYARVVQTSGEDMLVREALALINEQLDAFLAETEGVLDSETRFCAAWFEEFGFQEDDFGRAETLMVALNTALNALEQAGVFRAAAGKARLIRRDELPEDWDPATDRRLTVWECTQHLVRAVDREGESGAARLVARIGSGMSENARDLAYRLYNICERKGRSAEARGYNALVSSWQRIVDLARGRPDEPQQGELEI